MERLARGANCYCSHGGDEWTSIGIQIVTDLDKHRYYSAYLSMKFETLQPRRSIFPPRVQLFTHPHTIIVHHWRMRIQVGHKCSTLLHCPAVSGHFWTHPEIIPVGQFFRPWIKSINQSINQGRQQIMVETLHSRSCRLIVWLIDDKSTLTWLVYWIRTARSVFTGAGLKWPNTAGHYSYCDTLFPSDALRIPDTRVKPASMTVECGMSNPRCTTAYL